jgi:hypothetical protein
VTCSRRSLRTGKPCRREAAEWPGQRSGPGQPEHDWPDLPRVVACWTHLSEDERQMCLEARRRRNAAFVMESTARQLEDDNHADEVPVPEDWRQKVVEPRRCTGDCLSEAHATGAESDSAMSRCVRCDGYVCVSCGRAQVGAPLEWCDSCGRVVDDHMPEEDYDLVIDNANVPALRRTLNSLVARIVTASGRGFPEVQGQINRWMGVQRRDEAHLEDLQAGVERATAWLDDLEPSRQPHAAARLPARAPAAVAPALPAGDLAELQQALATARDLVTRLEALYRGLSAQ